MSETSNAEAPRRYVYITPHYTDSSNGEGTPLANRYSLGRYITHPRGIHRCFVFDDKLKFSQDFITSKQKRSKRLLSKNKFPPFTHTWLRHKELCKNIDFVVIIKAFPKEIKKKPSVWAEGYVLIVVYSLSIVKTDALQFLNL